MKEGEGGREERRLITQIAWFAGRDVNNKTVVIRREKGGGRERGRHTPTDRQTDTEGLL